MSDILINSFQWGLANDKNVWQTGAFWNSKNIEYRKNSSYVELGKLTVTAFSITGLPTALAYWDNGWTLASDLLVFCNDWKIFNSSGQQWTSTWGSVRNVIEANGIKYMIGQNKLDQFVALNSYTTLKTFATITDFRPVINFYGDLIIWDGTQVLRYNKDATLQEYTVWWTTPTIWSLQWTVYAITQIWPNVYVWCNDRVNTILYIWDWVSTSPSQKIVYADSPVKNVALIGNRHYWWSSKSDYSIKQVFIGESYSPQAFIKSEYPDYPISSSTDNDNNRIVPIVAFAQDLNTIETVWDIVYLPWQGCIYWFGKYFPWDKNPYAFSRDISFTGTTVHAMTSGSITTSGIDAGWYLAFAARNWSNYDINIVNLWQKWSGVSIKYASSGYIETLEYLAPDFAEWENSTKITFPFELPHSSTSIKVYVKYNRWSYTLIKTLNTTDYAVWYNFAEISDTGKWKAKQIKFELITSNSTYTPKLYTQIINKQQEVWKR